MDRIDVYLVERREVALGIYETKMPAATMFSVMPTINHGSHHCFVIPSCECAQVAVAARWKDKK